MHPVRRPPIASIPRGRTRPTVYRARRRRRRSIVGLLLAAGVIAGLAWAGTHYYQLRMAAAAAGEPVTPAGEVATPMVPVAPTEAPGARAPEPARPASPAPEADFRPRAPRDVFEAQVALARAAFCPGPIDGAFGGQTRAALAAFQQRQGLRVTGQLDVPTREALHLREPPLTTYTVTADDFLRLRPLPAGWLERASLDRMDFSSILELVAEKHWTHPNHIKRLNPTVDWTRVPTGTSVVVPLVKRSLPSTRAERIVIHLTDRTLQVFDGGSRVIAHFPCSIARRVDKRPVGGLTIVDTASDPNYTFRPSNFPESPEAQRVGRELILQPGPNNPVGVAWISLSLNGYGIHGSPEPEQIGRTESSGCFRLANWNARHLLSLVHVGMPVQVEL